MIEVINIVSDLYAKRNTVAGPNKVIKNLLLGLDRIGQKYVINQPIEKFEYNYIHDSIFQLIKAAVYRIPVVAGPNIAVLPKDLPRFLPNFKDSIYLHPSKWCVDVWHEFSYNKSKLDFWPVGIDWENWDIDTSKRDEKTVLVYLKRRHPSLADHTTKTLTKLGYTPIYIKYGSYNENQYKEALSKASFGVWLGISESQGIALQEALASNLPLVVVDVKSLFEVVPVSYIFPEKLKSFVPTSAPFFDNRCGIMINNIEFLGNAIKYLNQAKSTLKPQEFIIENLSMEKSAQWLISILKKINPSNKEQNNSFFKNLTIKSIYYEFVLERKSRTVLVKRLRVFKSKIS